MTTHDNTRFVSRAGDKLAFALDHWHIDVKDLICADLGCSTGGFTDCLLQRGAAKVYAVDTAYGILNWKLRNDSRVIVLERTNALHVKLPELVDFISIDVGWTPQRLILPAAKTLLTPGGQIISLIKPHYEAQKAHLTPQEARIISGQFVPLGQLVQSPIVGQKAGNVEYLMRVLY